ncbi:hypothetical protein C7E25_25375, partial [Stenotrophomonas maltophilia]
MVATPSREVELHLTGHMEKFSWSFDGIPAACSKTRMVATPSREVELHLTGHMEKFSWSFDG